MSDPRITKLEAEAKEKKRKRILKKRQTNDIQPILNLPYK